MSRRAHLCRACREAVSPWTPSEWRAYLSERRIAIQLEHEAADVERVQAVLYAYALPRLLGYCSSECFEGEPVQGAREEASALRARRRAENDARLRELGLMVDP